ncbi:MAG: hypothetical protein FJY34_04865 [Betaproteobacteria bacterium]|nr:hypothetical protein [Betaproteobacteria bacterium]
MHAYFRGQVLAVAVSSIVVFPAVAEEATIVVTATRQAMRTNELLSDVSVITREEIDRAGQSTVEQLLAAQPGIEYAANGGPGTNSSIFIRGASSRQTVVLIDGQRVGSASSGDVAFSRIPLSQIDRIEILRGPASSLYGADAIGGVIQIFTRRGEGPLRLNASAGYGTYGTADTSAGFSGGNEAVSYSLQIGHYKTAGFNAIGNPAKSSYNPDRDGYRNTNYSGSFAFRPAQGHEIGLNLLHSSGIIDPDAAAIARLRPDLIVASNWSDADTMELATPPGARMLRLDGFDSVAGSNAMLQQLAEASRAPDGANRIESFRHARRARAEAVPGRGQRALILSACSGSPYSFGRRHYVGDAFALAGFEVVETAPKIRHLRDGEEIPTIARLVEHRKPDIVFSLSREAAAYCNAEIGTLPVRIVTLSGENFFHPGPRLLDGLKELAEQMK